MRTSGSSIQLFLFLLLVPILLTVATNAAPLPTSPEQEMKERYLGTTKERNPPWILGFYGAYLDDVGKKVFDKTLSLTQRDVDDLINDNRGQWSIGVYNVTKNYWKLKDGFRRYKKDTIVLKRLKEPIGNNEMGEVKALKDVGLYIDSGSAPIGPWKMQVPVILMKKVDGVVMIDTAEFKNANQQQKVELLEQAKLHVRKQVVRWAVTKQLLHAEFNLGNFLVGGRQTATSVSMDTPITKAQLIDFGYPGIFKVKDDVTEKEVEDWFDLQWETCTKYGYDGMRAKEAKDKP
ncbi:hypothetical protein J3R30DRAFT_3440146 [Lentinula aciculospora]|uniref:Protein kinase domain-containing protein n=1 Tax=Lentinula aciculospora TaxID=153920 RepID=A0A9W9ANJ7_9AGAR|nr:hypothetical protein J3R30DRAFT_3440146 [Lentinula aciculospora]